jgi:hypothetical protein
MPVKRRATLIAAACAMIASLPFPLAADAQTRIARPRPAARAVVVRPLRPVFFGGYYYPTIYRPGLWYGSYAYGPPYFGPSYYQWGPFGYGRNDFGGSIRLQVEPEETEVFVDGYYAGQVDDFDGVFQRLHLEAGEHDVQLYLPGHRLFTQRLYLQPGRTFRIRHAMEPLGAGEPAPPRPTGAPMPRAGARDPRTRPGPGTGPPPATRAESFGELSLRVQPADADVLIDGERWTGPLENERLMVQLGAAVHRLEIRKDGYRSYFTDITIRNGETLTLNVALTKQ